MDVQPEKSKSKINSSNGIQHVKNMSEKGFSGSPVWDKTTNEFVGMLVASDYKDVDKRISFVVPFSDIKNFIIKKGIRINEINKSRIKIIRTDSLLKRKVPIQCRGNNNQVITENMNNEEDVYLPIGKTTLVCSVYRFFGLAGKGYLYIGKSKEITINIEPNCLYYWRIDIDNLKVYTSSTYRNLFMYAMYGLGISTFNPDNYNSWPTNIKSTIDKILE